MQKVYLLQAIAPAGVLGKFLRFDGGWDVEVNPITTWNIPVTNFDGVYMYPDAMASTVVASGMFVSAVTAFIPVMGTVAPPSATTAAVPAPPTYTEAPAALVPPVDPPVDPLDID